MYSLATEKGEWEEPKMVATKMYKSTLKAAKQKAETWQRKILGNPQKTVLNMAFLVRKTNSKLYINPVQLIH